MDFSIGSAGNPAAMNRWRMRRTQDKMSEIVDLLNEYQVIDDKDSLYARVLKSVIGDREIKLRRELERQIEASTRDRGYLARMRHFTRYAPLELLAEMYGQHRHLAP